MIEQISPATSSPPGVMSGRFVISPSPPPPPPFCVHTWAPSFLLCIGRYYPSFFYSFSVSALEELHTGVLLPLPFSPVLQSTFRSVFAGIPVFAIPSTKQKPVFICASLVFVCVSWEGAAVATSITREGFGRPTSALSSDRAAGTATQPAMEGLGRRPPSRWVPKRVAHTDACG